MLEAWKAAAKSGGRVAIDFGNIKKWTEWRPRSRPRGTWKWKLMRVEYSKRRERDHKSFWTKHI